jgi:hypothetical protein
MVQINLTTDEVVMLSDILKHYLSDLRMEVADTDTLDFRDKLKQEEAFLNRVLQQLGDAQG